MFNGRLAFWQAEFERLKALPEQERTPAIDSLMLTAAYMVGWSIAEQDGGHETCVTHG